MHYAVSIGMHSTYHNQFNLQVLVTDGHIRQVLRNCNYKALRDEVLNYAVSCMVTDDTNTIARGSSLIIQI